jgi:hypothetical protein
VVVPQHSLSTFEDLRAIDPGSGDFSRDFSLEIVRVSCPLKIRAQETLTTGSRTKELPLLDESELDLTILVKST